jgi:hypothetical protein
MLRDDEKLVTVASFTKLPEAEAVRLMLESRGITCFLSNAEIVAMDWLISNAVGGIKVQVPEAQVERAVKVLNKRIQRRNNIDDYGLDRQSMAQPGEVTAAKTSEDSVRVGNSQIADKTVDRAWRAAWIGCITLPFLLHFYSLWLLLELPFCADSVSAPKRRLIFFTILLDVIVILIGIFLPINIWHSLTGRPF